MEAVGLSLSFVPRQIYFVWGLPDLNVLPEQLVTCLCFSTLWPKLVKITICFKGCLFAVLHFVGPKRLMGLYCSWPWLPCPCGFIHQPFSVLFLSWQLVMHLEKEALNMEGILRVPGAVTRVKVRMSLKSMSSWTVRLKWCVKTSFFKTWNKNDCKLSKARLKHTKGSRECYLLGQNTSEFWG